MDVMNLKLDKSNRENNKLKLDNAALRAENQILKRQLNYFEDLFAKNNRGPEHFSMTKSTHSSSRASTRQVGKGSSGEDDEAIRN
jgi:hypothetical protein